MNSPDTTRAGRKSPEDFDSREARLASYRKEYDVDTLAQMCVDSEDAYDRLHEALREIQCRCLAMSHSNKFAHKLAAVADDALNPLRAR